MDTGKGELKRMDASQLIEALLAETRFDGFERTMLLKAIDFGGVLHRDQVRHEVTPDGRVDPPYFEHPLRNTLRLLRWGVRDAHILVASLLHDTVEDCGEVFVSTYTDLGPQSRERARELLAVQILHRFGYEVHRIVLGVTNPYHTPEAWAAYTPEERRSQYRLKVVESIRSDASIFLVKLSDYIDNAGSLHWIPADRHRTALRLARKYHPLVEDFQAAAELHHFSHLLPAVEVPLERLAEAARRLDTILTDPTVGKL